MAFDAFVPEIWSARILEHLDKALVYGQLFNRDYEGEIKNQGDTVHIGMVSAPTIKTYTKGTAIEDPESVDGTDQTLVISQSDYFNIAVDDIDKAQSAINLLDSATAQTGQAFGEVTDKYLAGVLSAAAGIKVGTKEAPKTVSADTAYGLLVDLNVALNKANCPKDGRIVIVPPEFEGFMLKDDRFVKYDQAGADNLATGTVFKAAGFIVQVSNNAPVETVTGGTKEAPTTTTVYDVIASAPVQGTFAEQITETEPYRVEKGFSDAMKGLHVYGAKTLRPEIVACAKVSF